MGAVFGSRHNSEDDVDDDCGDDRAKCLAADRAAGRIDPEVLDKADGSFTEPNAQQTAYLIAVNERHAALDGNSGTTRLAVFDGRGLVLNAEVGDYWEMPKTFDLNRDGVNELLLAGGSTQADGTVWRAELIELRGGKPSTVKDFDRVYLDGCETSGQNARTFGTMILYTPAAPGAFPSDFRQDVYRSACGVTNWKYVANGKVPGL
jgi:hypothetical protein